VVLPALFGVDSNLIDEEEDKLELIPKEPRRGQAILAADNG
jgi:hypothetical protein